MSYRFRHPDLHQEPDRVPVWRFMVALAVVLVVSAVTVVWAVDMTEAQSRELRPSGFFPEKFLGPRHPVGRVRADLFEEQQPQMTVEARDRADLETYGWVDEGRGVVSIPVERAMELFVAGRRP
jgi:hypothetical protein